MKNLKIAHRYAKALFSLMLESKLEEKTYEDMQLINQVFSDSKELQILLKSPIVR
ncbi:MAG: F0F1 ATP synthase subunit delta, partial [Bacteroidales bacterium]|nr:F0F1 ATP synthase subunit delta [Bacteroidales bacterium]